MSQNSRTCFGRSYLVVLLLLLLASGSLRGQQPEKVWPTAPRFDRLSTTAGLSQVTVLAALQDRRGFMWFGTQNGLNRYDGYEFVVYKSDADDSLSLSSNFIYALYEDRDGFLWVGTRDGGLNQFDPATETFRRYTHDSEDSTTLSGNFVHAITQDRQGALWVGTWGQGLNRLDPKTGNFIRYKADPAAAGGLSHNAVTSLLADRSGALWIGTYGGGLNRLDPGSGKFTHYRHDPANPSSLGEDRVMGLLEDTTGARPLLWVATSHGGLNRLDPATGRFTHYRHDPADPFSLSNNLVHQLRQDRRRPDWLWVGTWGGGLCHFDKRSGQFYAYQNDPDDPSSLSANTVYPIVEDMAGRIWVGTQSGGISRIDPAKQRFRHYRKPGAGEHGLSGNNITALLRDRSGDLWVGLEADLLNRMDARTGSVRFYNLLPSGAQIPGTRTGETRGLFEDPAGMIWITTGGSGLARLDPRGGQFRHYLADPTNPLSFKGNDLTVLHPARRGGFWIGSFNWGLYHFDPATGTVHNFQPNPADTTSLSGKDVYSLLEDAAGQLWVGTRTDGLNLMLPDGEKFERFRQRPGGLTANSIYAIHESARLPGVIWLGTEQGLNVLILPSNNRGRLGTQARFDHYLEKDGLPGNVVYGILEDDRGHLWLSTNKGIVQFRLPARPEERGQVMRSFSKSDGLTADEFNYGAYHRAPDGELLFGGVEGVTAFYPGQLQGAAGQAPLVFTTFEKYTSGQAGAEPISVKGIGELADLTLSYRDNIFTIGFALLNYAGADRNQYSYRLEGFADNWIPLGANRRLTFTNLDPGRYRLRVRATGDGGTNFTERTLHLFIRPPWWRTGWAYTLFGLLLAGALALLWRYEKNRLRIKEQLRLEHAHAAQLRELDQLKSRFFANISHEFRTPLTLILGPLEELSAGRFRGEVRQQYELMQRNARRLLGLINQLLDLARLEAGKLQLEPQWQDVVPFVRRISSSFHSLAVQKEIKLQVSAGVTSLYTWFDPEKLETILSNLLSNAFKFTPRNGSIEVQVNEQADVNGTAGCGITILDTGTGIAADDLEHIFDRFYQAAAPPTTDQPGSGIGLALARELVELHQGHIGVQSREGHGTTFSLWLPVGAMPAPETPAEPEFLTQPRSLSTVVAEEAAGAVNGSLMPGTEKSAVILIVEDNADMRTFIDEQLRREYQVLQADSGTEGLEKAFEHIPDLIISDVMMPGLDGQELCRRLNEDDRTSHIPVILLTALSSQENKLAGLESGAADYLVKPFNAPELQVRVRNTIHRQRRLRERFSRPETILQPQSAPDAPPRETAFLKKLADVIEAHLDDETLDVQVLARAATMSRAQLYRKLQALTGQSVGEFILAIRLARAAERLRAGDGSSVAEVAFSVGFRDPSYFTKCFRKQFGVSPTAYRTGSLAEGQGHREEGDRR